MPNYVPGIDVSHWQGKIDWPKVREAGKRFTFIKATEGTSFFDDKFNYNWVESKKAGLIRGAYHFFRPLMDAKTQAEWFLSHIPQQDLVGIGDLPPTLDMEVTGNLKSSTFIQRVEVWMAVVEKATGVKPIIYSNYSLLNFYFRNSTGMPPLWTKDHLLWLANYLPDTATQPHMPSGWEEWTFWQHSQTGKCPGINGNVDLNWYNGTVAQLYSLVGLEEPGGGTTPVPTYQVKPGDTLISIAEQFKISLQSLVIANPQLIVPGMALKIPPKEVGGEPGGSGGGSGGSGGTGGSGTPPAGTTYVVQPGDNLTKIAARFNTTVAALVVANNITNPDMIQVGQVLKIV